MSELLGVTAVVCRGLAALLCPKVITHWLGPPFLLVPVQSVLMFRWWKSHNAFVASESFV